MKNRIYESTAGQMEGKKERREGGRKANSLIAECQPVNIKEMTLLEDHHLATIILTDSGKNHQRMLKLVGESLLRNKIFT
jgi:hypothetical protein